MKLSVLASLVPFYLSCVASQGFYRNSDVMELDSSTFKEVVLNSNQTSIIEFYAPWCGHCQNLKPQFMKVGKHLDDIANIGAVNCDEGKNKKLCAEYRIEGYPTIIAFRPPKYDLYKKDAIKYGHATESYLGSRKTKPIVEFATGRIKNYVKRLATGEKLNLWLNDERSQHRPKFVVFPRRDKLSPLLKSIAVEFLGDIDFAYMPLRDHDKLASVMEEYEIDPKGEKAVVYFFKDGSDPSTRVLYDGDFSKRGIANFIRDLENFDEVSERVLNRLEFIEGVKSGAKKNKKSKSKSQKTESKSKKTEQKKKQDSTVRDEF